MKLFYTDVFELPLPPGHRFPMSKYRLLREHLAASTDADAYELCLPPAASDVELMLTHTSAYVRNVSNGSLTAIDQRRIGFPWSPGMVERSRRSVGATLAAARVALTETVSVNLAGGTHHASANRGQGYCVFNDAAVALRVLLAEGQIRRALIVDCDVHHGNGTAMIFQDDPHVFTFSIHSARIFPSRKPPSDLDIALPAGCDDATYVTRLTAGLKTALEAARPDLVVYLAGADPFAGDALGDLSLSKSGLARRDETVFTACRRRDIPIAVTMAGGYAPCVQDIVSIHARTVRLAAEFRDA